MTTYDPENPPTEGTLVEVTDLATGESETAVIVNNYVLICDGSAELSGSQVWPKSGTHQLTVKGVRAS